MIEPIDHPTLVFILETLAEQVVGGIATAAAWCLWKRARGRLATLGRRIRARVTSTPAKALPEPAREVHPDALHTTRRPRTPESRRHDPVEPPPAVADDDAKA